MENNPDITIVKTESLQRKRDYLKVTNTENNNAKLMSGGGAVVSELSTTTSTQQQLQQQQKNHDSLSINNDHSKP